MFGLGRKRERLWRDGSGVACSMLGPGLAGMFLELREWFSSSLIFIYMYEDMMQACTHKQHTYIHMYSRFSSKRCACTCTCINLPALLKHVGNQQRSVSFFLDTIAHILPAC